jgi:hypothetical protein
MAGGTLTFHSPRSTDISRGSAAQVKARLDPEKKAEDVELSADFIAEMKAAMAATEQAWRREKERETERS